MVVKERRGRRRYIIFRMPTSYTSKGALIAFMRRAADAAGFPAPYVVQVKGDLAIIRCSPQEREGATAFMRGLGGESLLCSGTLRTLRLRYGL